jgi:hypothetical protein
VRIHTKLDAVAVGSALLRAKDAGHVTPDVGFTGWSAHKSRTHGLVYAVQLGTADRGSLPLPYRDQNGKRMLVRRRMSSGAGYYAATWHEWGWFIAEIYKLDREAVIGPYLNHDDFHWQTDAEFYQREKEDA